MLHSYRVRSVSRWITPVFVFLLVLGHACELPAVAGMVSDATEDTHHSADHHADENLISCDAVGVPSSPGHLQVGPSLDVAEVRPVTRQVPGRLIISSQEISKRLLSRPPLFLLHASLLI
jgi:hypothetical protein